MQTSNNNNNDDDDDDDDDERQRGNVANEIEMEENAIIGTTTESENINVKNE